MRREQPAKLVRLHLSEADRFEGRPLFEVLVQKCRDLHIAGATVFRGLEGYGETAGIHRRHLLGSDQPIVVTIIDSPENISRLLPILESMLDKGVIATSDVSVVRIQRGDRPLRNQNFEP